MNIFKIIIAGLVSLTLLAGCTTVAAVSVGDDTKAYVDGVYSMSIEGNVEDVYDAAVKAINNDEDYIVVTKTMDEQSGDIEGATKIDSTNFYVKVDKVAENISKVTIKFGHFGDQEQSTKLMDQIQKNVKG